MRWGFVACLLLGLAACGATRYQKLNDFTDQGYSETQASFGHYIVSYHGTNLEFCKKSAFYRCAELGSQLGFAFFKVTGEQVVSSFNPRTAVVVGEDSTNRSVGADVGTAGLQRKDNVAGYNYAVEYLKSDPGLEGVTSVQKVLRGMAKAAEDRGAPR